MQVAFVLLLFAVFLGIDGKTTLKQTGAGFRVLYCAMMLLSFVVLLLYSLGISVPSPTDPIVRAVSAIVFGGS